jgi:hypothetical protein
MKHLLIILRFQVNRESRDYVMYKHNRDKYIYDLPIIGGAGSGGAGLMIIGIDGGGLGTRTNAISGGAGLIIKGTCGGGLGTRTNSISGGAGLMTIGGSIGSGGPGIVRVTLYSVVSIFARNDGYIVTGLMSVSGILLTNGSAGIGPILTGHWSLVSILFG